MIFDTLKLNDGRFQVKCDMTGCKGDTPLLLYKWALDHKIKNIWQESSKGVDFCLIVGTEEQVFELMMIFS